MIQRRKSPVRTCVWISTLVLLFVACACEPPGYPKPEPKSASEITDFKTLYQSNCAGCHSVDGMSGPARPLNNPLYLAIVPKAELVKVITYGREGTAMPAWAISQGGPLTDQQVQALVNGMEQNWSKPIDFHGAAVPSYAAGNAAGDPDKGKKLFGKDCFVCHGPGAPIGPVTDPSYLSLVSNQVLRTSIIEGWPKMGMPDYRSLNLGKALSDQDITDLVAYLVSKRPPVLTAGNSSQGGVGK